MHSKAWLTELWGSGHTYVDRKLSAAFSLKTNKHPNPQNSFIISLCHSLQVLIIQYKESIHLLADDNHTRALHDTATGFCELTLYNRSSAHLPADVQVNCSKPLQEVMWVTWQSLSLYIWWVKCGTWYIFQGVMAKSRLVLLVWVLGQQLVKSPVFIWTWKIWKDKRLMPSSPLCDFQNYRLIVVFTRHDYLGSIQMCSVFALHNGSATGSYTLHDFTIGRITDNCLHRKLRFITKCTREVIRK